MHSLVPHTVRESVDELRGRLLSVFDRYAHGRTVQEEPFGQSAWFSSFQAQGGPVVEIEETPSEILVMAEMPGLAVNDFKVELESHRLLIHGEKKSAHEKQERRYFYSECNYGAFHRVIPLPCEVDPSQSEATFKDGILRVRLPKVSSAQARTIEIKTG